MSKKRPREASVLYLGQSAARVPREVYALIASKLDRASKIALHWAQFGLDPNNADYRGKIDAAIASSIEHGWTDLAKWFAAKCGNLLKQSHFSAAAASGKVELLEWVEEMASIDKSITEPYRVAAQAGHLNVLKWLWNRSYKGIERVPHAAAVGNHLDVMKWALSVGYPPSVACMDAALSSGHMESVQWMISMPSCIGMNARLVDIAVMSGNVELVKWLRSQGFSWSERATVNAAARGKLHMLQYLRSEQCPWDAQVVYKAAVYGHANVVEWATSNGCPCDMRKIWDCGYHQHQVHSWLRARKIAPPAQIPTAALVQGDTEALDYMLANGSRIPDNAWIVCIQQSILDTLRWLRANTDHIPREALSLSALHGRLDVAIWLICEGAVVTEQDVLDAESDSSLGRSHWCIAKLFRDALLKK